MHAAVRVKQQAALIAIRRNLAADIGLAQHVDRHAEIALQRLRIARHRRESAFVHAPRIRPLDLQLGVDLLVDDQRFRKFERRHAFTNQIPGLLLGRIAR